MGYAYYSYAADVVIKKPLILQWLSKKYSRLTDRSQNSAGNME